MVKRRRDNMGYFKIIKHTKNKWRETTEHSVVVYFEETSGGRGLININGETTIQDGKKREKWRANPPGLNKYNGMDGISFKTLPSLIKSLRKDYK